MTKIRPLPHIDLTKPYVPGGKLKGASAGVVMLASNENPFGPSPAAIAAMQDVAASVHVYPDPTYTVLRETIARAKGITDVSRLAVSAGSDEIIHLLTQAYAGPGDEILFTEHAFSMYRVSATSHGATPVTVPETDCKAGVNAILSGVSDRTKILFLANPNNPTGTMLPVEDLQRIQDSLPPHVMFVIDGAYAEFVSEAYEDALRDLVDRRDNTVMIRTFSKIYGLAALRLGWGYFPEAIAATFQRIRPPFNINAFAVAAGMASIEDRDFIAKSREHNAEWRAILTERLDAMGLVTPHSDANFVLPDFGSAERAAEANEFLKANNILIRAVGGYGLPTKLRITVGTAEDNERVLAKLAEFTATR